MQEQAKVADAAAKAKLQGLVTTGAAALQAKNYDAAEKALRSASQIDPAHSGVIQGLKDIAQFRQTQQNYQSAMNVGKTALANKDYPSAIKSFQQALQVMPKDPQATQFLQQAQVGTDVDPKTAAQFKAAMDAGQTALTAKKYATAVASFNAALKIHPTDANARQMLTQAQQALNDTNQATAQANYQKAMTAGKAALTLKRYPDAARAFNDALKWVPNDAQATQQLQVAQQEAIDSAPSKTGKTPPPADPAKAFNDAMQRGADFAKDAKHADALKAYQEALKIRPKDKTAQYSVYMAQGYQYLDNAMWIFAQQQAEAALRLFPNDQAALQLQKKAKNKMK